MHYLDLDILKEEVPSVFAETPHQKVSDKYTFIPTTKVIEVLRDQGWLPTKANQYKSKKDESSNEFRKHLLRFRNEQFSKTMKVVGDTLPEIVLFNSHNGTSSFSFHVGLFRLVCSNGLVIPTQDFGNFKIRHQNYDPNHVIDIVNEITGNFPQVYGKIDVMSSKILSNDDIIEYGKMAIERHWGEERNVDINGLLQVRREADKGNDLWKVFNRVQENMLKGGIITTRKVDGREIINRTREVKSIDQNVSINKMLWNLSEEWV